MGSPSFRSLDVGPFNVVEAWFPAGLELPLHLHDRTTFAVMLDGSFDLRVTGRTYVCEPSAVFTEPLGEKHGNRVGAAGARVLVLQPDHEQSDLFDACNSIFSRVAHFQHAGIRSLGRRLAYELRTSDSTSRLAAQGLGLEMLALAARTREPEPTRSPAWLITAVDMIQSNFLGQMSLVDVARAVDVHPSYLARAFRKCLGESIGSYVRRLRLEWACERLATTDDPIASIALEAGFSDQAHLTRLLKRETGVTPGRYRVAMRT
jgi:AraC family transcriptional regulator